MKYFKPSGQGNVKDLDIIAGEMINIMTGIKYYTNGILLDKTVPKYNLIKIDSVGFELNPNVGVLLLLNHTNIFPTLEHRVSELWRYAGSIHGPLALSSGSTGTTQYICITDTNSTLGIKYVRNQHPRYIQSNTGGFIWLIYDTIQSLANSPIYIPYFTAHYLSHEERALSTVTIIYDGINGLLLENEYSSPDMPLINKYKPHADKLICDKPICITARSGIGLEITKNFMKHNAKVIFYDSTDTNIFWMKWENVKPRKRVTNFEWNKQVRNQMFPKYENWIGKPLDSMQDVQDLQDTQETLTCFMTGVPIYEDCYVFDIYEQTIYEDIDERELPQAIKLGAHLVSSEDEKKDLNVSTSTLEIKEPVRRTRTNSRRTTQNNQSDTKTDTKVNTRENQDPIKVTTKKVRQLPKKKSKSDSESEHESEIKEEPIKYVRIRKTINHDEPIHLLISPYAMHYAEHNHLVGTKLFELLSGAKVIVYRTFCPRLCKDVIDSLEADQIYKDFLYAFDHSITLTSGGRSYRSTFKNKTYEIYHNFNICDIFNMSTNTANAAANTASNAVNNKIIGLIQPSAAYP